MTICCYEIRTLDDLVKLLDEITQLLDSWALTYQDALFLRLATEEACMNSYEHGTRCGHPSFAARIVMEPQEFKLIIIETGLVEDILSEEPAERPITRGRGLALINNIMDEVSVTQIGDKVHYTLRKCISPGKP